MKKAFSTMIALVMALLAGVPALAADAEITGLSDNFGYGGYTVNGGELKRGTSLRDWEYLGTVMPGAEYFLPLRRKDFEWGEDGAELPINARYAQELGISLYTTIERGDTVIESLKLVERGGQYGILLKLEDTLVSVEKEEFDIRAKLLVFDTEYPDSQFRVRGSMTNNKVTVGAYTTSCSLGHGRYAFGYDNMKNVRFDLGAGVSVSSDISLGEKLYGGARAAADDQDRAVLSKHPQIARTIHVETLNLTGKVRIDPGELGVCHVYDDTLEYLGTTNQTLRMSGRYYLSPTKL